MIEDRIIYNDYFEKILEKDKEIDELYERIFTLEELRYSLEDKLELLRKYLLHSSLSIEDMQRIGGFFE